MKVITILGSPRKKGKTAQTLDLFENNLLIKGYDVERICLTDHQIKGCVGCHSCMNKNDAPECVLKDDAISIFEKMILADVIVYASPIYCYDFTSQFKTFIDRHWCLTQNYGTPYASSNIAGKKVALLITCMGTAEQNADLAQEIFDRSMKGVLRCNIIGKYVVSLSESPDFKDRAEGIVDKLLKDILVEKS
jgi:multimeric flavodoxin WrbA